MDQIRDRNPSKSEVIGRCGGDEKPNHAEPTKSHAKNPNKTSRIDCSLMLQKVKMSQSNNSFKVFKVSKRPDIQFHIDCAVGEFHCEVYD